MVAQNVLNRQLVIGEILARQARKNPHRIALVDGERTLTYKELNRRVNHLASTLSDLGVDRGDKVAMMLFNSVEIVECYFAIAKLGGVAVPANFRLTGRELVYIANHSEAKVLVFDEIFSEMIDNIRGDLPKVEHYIHVGHTPNKNWNIANENLLIQGNEQEPLVPVTDDEPAFILYTSGTTGRPKGAVLTHKNKTVNAINSIIELGVTDEEVCLCVPPLFHAAALSLLFMMVLMGNKTVLVRQFNPEDLVNLVAKESATITFLVPVMWQAVLGVPGLTEKMKSMKKVITGAAIMPLPLKQAVLQQLPWVGLADVFGQTEMSPSTTILKPQDTLRKGASVGRPMINVEVRVVDNEGQDVAPGEVGEIIYRGPTMLKEYYRDPAATAAAIVDGWFYSGDLVRMDEEGFVYVVDRKKDMVISGGENVYPAEVEEVLYQHEQILEAAVIGAPDIRWGERVHAVVVPKPGATLTEREVIDWCGQHLASYKKPRSITFVKELPRNASGKVLKTTLREWHNKEE